MKVICFDLDDTLHKEVEYLKAAYRLIAQEAAGEAWQPFFEQMLAWWKAGDDVMAKVSLLAPRLQKAALLEMYRYGVHQLTLDAEVETVLTTLQSRGVALGLITDGRTRTQRTKIAALGLERYFPEEMIVISEAFGSEKPSAANYEHFMRLFPECHDFTYVGDNPKKDFIAPNALRWTTVCLRDNGENIHPQNFEATPTHALPQKRISALNELLLL
ncbi:MAG: HAD family hydrolase [Bacteroidales bacterium]|nr:HAD family hydrolase [Bacteroidales bacterium]